MQWYQPLVPSHVTFTAQLTVPILADTEQPAAEMTAMIGI
jgi:hypothetical protein